MVLRRDFLRVGALAVPAGLAHAGIPTHSHGKSCIFLRLVGGPSQLDTWDLKPEAPSHVRGAFQAIRTNVPGIEIAEIFPRMARHADKYTLIRSMWHDGEPVHESGDELARTGDLVPGHVLLQDGPLDFHANCRKAVELVASGTPFVTVNMFESVFDQTTWDSHGWKPFSTTNCYRDVVGPMFDTAYSGLLTDLARRGILESTLVVASGEFGRTPRINPTGGRDHWPGCWTALVAGGGVRGGQVYGSSDALGAEPRENPVTPSMLAATMLDVVGISVQGSEPVRALFS